MKVKVVSDLHLEMCEQGHGVPDLGEGEVLILGGDILCARHFKTNGKPAQYFTRVYLVTLILYLQTYLKMRQK